jgi:hypothetical protein
MRIRRRSKQQRTGLRTWTKRTLDRQRLARQIQSMIPATGPSVQQQMDGSLEREWPRPSVEKRLNVPVADLPFDSNRPERSRTFQRARRNKLISIS